MSQQPPLSLASLVMELSAHLEDRWRDQLAQDVKTTIKQCLETLATNCSADELSIAKRSILIKETYQLLIQRVKCGFTFDEASATVGSNLYYLSYDPQKSLFLTVPQSLNIINNEGGGGFLSGTLTNTLIVGENYYALQNLSVAGLTSKVDIIYIDPPYNTKELQSYKDKFQRHGWLSMLKERLVLAKKLLAETGVIFVSIDDHEQAYLKVLMDEIFGEENFVTNIIRKTRSASSQSKNNVNVQHEYCLLYAKNNELFQATGGAKSFTHYKNPDHDPRGLWISDNPTIGLALGSKKNNYFGIKNPYTQKVDFPSENCQWRFSEGKSQEYIAVGKIKFLKKYGKNQRGFIFKRYQSEIRLKVKVFNSLQFCPMKCAVSCTHCQNVSRYMNQAGTKEFLKLGLFGTNEKNFFLYPKPTQFIIDLLKIIDCKDAIVLDFFAGSGTTGHAVLALNRQDGGTRKFILVTNKENNIDQICYERLHRIIKGVGTGTKRVTNFPWITNNQPFNVSLQVFSIVSSNVTSWNYQQKNFGFSATINPLLQKVINGWQKFNPAYQVTDQSQLWTQLLALTYNTNADNKEHD